MVQLERGPRGADRAALECQDIGGALLVHPEGEIDPRVHAFVGGLAKDPEHTLVVVDLPEDPPAEDWESVAKLLRRRGRSFRVIIGRPSRETAMRVGQLLADRLDRTVLTPDGRVLPAAGGVLFIPEDAGCGWLGFQPRRPSAWTRLAPHRKTPRMSRRFPVPDWDGALPARSFATSAGGTVEPLPAGAWIRRTDHPESERDVHRGRLSALLLCQSDRLTVVLGCPGGPDLSVMDIERFWECVAPDARPQVRFAQYGPVGVPEGRAFGQYLADRFGQEVTVYAGLPTAAEPGTDGPRMCVPGKDGTPGPPAFARELVYRPAGVTGAVAPPVLSGCRPPLDGLPEISTGVYQYAPDAVLEVTQSGLWLRPRAASVHPTAVQCVPADPSGPAIHFDAGTPESAQRMRSVAEEVRQKLDPSLAEACRVLPAPQEAPAHAPSQAGAAAPGTVRLSESVPGPGADTSGSAAGSVGQSVPTASGGTPAGPAMRDTGAGQVPLSAPAEVLESVPDVAVGGSGVGGAGAGAVAVPAVGEAAAGAGSAGSAPVVGGPAASGGAPVGAADTGAGQVPLSAGAGVLESVPDVVVGGSGVGGAGVGPVAVPAVGEAVDGPGSAGSPPVVAGPAASGAGQVPSSLPAPIRPRALRLESAPPSGAVPAEGADGPSAGEAEVPSGAAEVSTAGAAEVPVAGADTVDHPAAGTAPPDPAPVPPPTAAPAPVVPGPSVPAPAPSPAARPKAQGAAVRVQPVPTAEACAALPERGIEQERTWLRRTFQQQYDAAANHVARVLSESPGLRGGSRQSADDVVTDLVAVRLYLSGGTDRIDNAVRSAAVGPHVPLARCVASGLRRLPSYRGATMLRTTLNEAEWQWYGKRRVVTEWAFCSALTTAHPDLPGDVDVMIWSMTARRTALLDPTVPDRVFYLPGTSFKVLGVRDEERRVLLLRELTGPEIGADGSVDLRRLPLDDIAITRLEQAAVEWRDTKPAVRLPATAVGALRHPPGLIPTDRSASRRSADTAPPRKGTTP